MNYGTGGSDGTSLTDQVTALIDTINHNTKIIEKQNQKLGKNSDTHEFRHSLNEKIEKTTKQVKKLTNLLTQGNKRDKYFSKLQKQSKECLNRFQSEAKKSQTIQREHIAQERKSMSFESPEVYPNDEEEENDRLLRQQKIQQEKNLQQEIHHNERILMERETDIKEIEESVVEIAGIMREIDTLVNEQGDDLDTIGDRISESGTKVEEAKGHLTKAESYDKGGRWLICIILGIVACVTLGVCIGIIVLLKILMVF
eukprot:gene1253-11342_t